MNQLHGAMFGVTLPSAMGTVSMENEKMKDNVIYRQAAIDDIKEIYEYHDTVTEDRIIDHLKRLPSAQPDIIHCKDCKYWMPYDWMFSEVWRSVSMDDYSDDEIGCAYCDMNMHANDFCSRAERRTDETD